MDPISSSIWATVALVGLVLAFIAFGKALAARAAERLSTTQAELLRSDMYKVSEAVKSAVAADTAALRTELTGTNKTVSDMSSKVTAISNRLGPAR